MGGTAARRVRFWLLVVVVGLVASGVTAFPLVAETRWLDGIVQDASWAPRFAKDWIAFVTEGIGVTKDRYPFLAYGTDWLAFAHLVIAVAFVGPLREPVRNKRVVQWGTWCCAGIVPLALICGPIRGIPFWWSVIDLSFAAGAIVPLWRASRGIRLLERADGRGRDGTSSTISVGA
jgi:hypothetical protein